MAGVDAKGRKSQKKNMKAAQKKKAVAENKQEAVSNVDTKENSSASLKNSIESEEKPEEQDETEVQEQLPKVNEPNQQDEKPKDNQNESEDEDDEEEDEDEVELSDLEGVELEEDADLVRKRKLALNNTIALESIYEKIKYPDNISFVENQAITTNEPVVVENVEDDLTRELAFYKQGVESVKAAFVQLEKHKVPITRPSDYFAEMLKSDAHMEKVRQELIKEATSKKLSEQAKKQRELKKFGKQVQLAKQEERQRSKKDTLEKINLLKRKSSGSDLTTEDDFDVTLANAEKEEKSKQSTKKTKNEKFGFGGRKHGRKSNDADSLAATEFGKKGLKALYKKGNKSRPGKARREKARK
ncbi:rRNA processing protein Ebp2 [Schizosaccharomyces octosporus yFS286]|uniref:rRNA processing protein Ebp2 n=1 Tax=Schizosaccharomyces octosporus (strain yFS286) TaxID=483514 RepID=S9PSR8_SCHOY|nr:rRNA processing protein Ebp2 [Schizosaccharomyces octosporus yFS286]EPX70533.1 rRNA processing protein Ebp2 [Schizosaccharomyces octosporus yFS286]